MANTPYCLLSIPLIIAGVLSASCKGLETTRPAETIAIPSGVIVGDVDDDSAVIWSRADREAIMTITIKGKQSASNSYQVQVDSGNDYTGQIVAIGLTPNTIYSYRVGFESRNNSIMEFSEIISGQFKTAPRHDQKKAVKFIWGGDLAGQNVCRDVAWGFPVFYVINQIQMDFFIGLGDMIYADGTCDILGYYGNRQVPGEFTEAVDLEHFWAHWAYNRSDAELQKLLLKTPYVAVWDDHEVINDFGPLHDTGSSAPYDPEVNLLPIGIKAFIDYNPIAISADTPNRLYRNIRWGQHVEMFILDTRQYRDANFMPDNEAVPKTMLGREQLAWLKHKLAASDATWKIVISSVPMSIPIGHPKENGRDGWANYDQDGGFEHELREILRYIQQQKIKNNLWLSTDVHFSTGFSYTPFSDAPDFKVYEFISGPLSAGFFPTLEVDDSLAAKRLFMQGATHVRNYYEALEYFTFGVVEIAENGDLTMKIINAKGQTVATQFVEAQ